MFRRCHLTHFLLFVHFVARARGRQRQSPVVVLRHLHDVDGEVDWEKRFLAVLDLR